MKLEIYYVEWVQYQATSGECDQPCYSECDMPGLRCQGSRFSWVLTGSALC